MSIYCIIIGNKESGLLPMGITPMCEILPSQQQQQQTVQGQVLSSVL